MKYVTALVMGGMAWATAALADPATGTWQTEVDDGSFAHIQLAPCGEAICGTIARTFYADGAEYDSPNKGTMIVQNMVAAGDGTYEGSVFRPSNGRTYLGKLDLSGDRLQLRGCVAGGLFCARQNWVRVN